MILEDGFFLVWTPYGANPQRRHATAEIALTEAHRLAKCHPGKKYVVLKAVAQFHVRPQSTHTEDPK